MHKMCFNKFCKILRKTPMSESFCNKVADWRPATLLNKTPVQVFSSDFWEVFKNTLLVKHLWKATFNENKEEQKTLRCLEKIEINYTCRRIKQKTMNRWLTSNRIFFFQKRSHRRCSIKKAVLKNFAIFTGKHLHWSLFLKACNFIKKETRTQVFPVNIAKFLRTLFCRTPPVAASVFLYHLNCVLSQDVKLMSAQKNTFTRKKLEQWFKSYNFKVIIKDW